MGRPVILGNGALTIGINEHGLVHDFYYPYVGLENLTTSRLLHHSVGVWAAGTFSWVDDGSWHTVVDFEDEALISTIVMQNEALNIELRFKDFVDAKSNLFGRRVSVINHGDTERDIRLFMHQVFQISHAGRADTALYELSENYILDYKGRCTMLIGGIFDGGKPFDQYAVGNYGVEGKEGTFRDAEDGDLSCSNVEHGGVDSVIRFQKNIPAYESMEVDYWVIADDTQQAAEKLHKEIKLQGLGDRLEATRLHWKKWLDKSQDKRAGFSDDSQPWVTKSLLVIKAHVDKRGGIIASCDSSIYNYGRDYYSYVWPRDGAYAIWPLIRLGYKTEAKRFFTFCRDVMHPDGYMLHKYQPDRAIGSTWHPLVHDKRSELAIQEDETAILVFMLGEYMDHTGDKEFVYSMYESFIRPAANFMAKFIDQQTGLPHASYDLWEQKFMTHTYTVSLVYRALIVASSIAKHNGHHDDAEHWSAAAEMLAGRANSFYDNDGNTFIKGFLLNQNTNEITYDKTLDVSSPYGVFMFGYPVAKEQLFNCISAIERVLLESAPIGGVPRYENDGYFASPEPYKGNPWFVTTLWMAQYYIRVGNRDKGEDLINWCMTHGTTSKMLAEQTDTVGGMSVSVMPLVWSHAELVNTLLDLLEANS